MRMFMSVQMSTARSNEALVNGKLPQVMGKFIETFRPESAYFITVDGERCAHFYFDLKDVSQMIAVAEPFFLELNAKITYCPAMNPDDLQKGVAAFLPSR